MHHKSLSLGLACLLAGTLTVSSPLLSAEAKTLRTGVVVTREFRQANQSLQTGKYATAETQFTNMLKKNPNNTAVRSGLALTQAELYKLDAAEKNANQVLAKDPKNAMAYASLGAVLRNRTASLDMTYKSRRDELLAESAAQLEKAAMYDSHSPEIQNQLGLTYSLQGRYGEAQQAFNKALALDTHFAEARVNQGVTKFLAGDTAGAKSAYQRAILTNSKNHSAHYRLGEALLKEGQAHEALKSLNTALALSPGNSAILNKMAEAYQAQGNTSAAVATYQKAMLGNPGYMPSYLGLADIYDNRGDGEMAMSVLKSAINVSPSYTQGYNQLGKLALVVNKPDQAIQYYQESLKIDPHDSVALQGLSQALIVTAQNTASESAFNGQESNITDAEQMLEQAIRLNPNDLGLRLAHLRISQLSGKPAASEAELQRITSMPARTDAEKIIQGQAYYALGNYPQSDRIFQSLIQQSRGDSKKLLLLGDTLKAEGDLPTARLAYMAVPAGNLKAERALSRIDKQEAESQKSLRFAKAMNRGGLLGLKIFNRSGKASALDGYEESLSQNPRQPEARLEVSKLYEKMNRYDEAARSYQMYLGLVPNMPSDDRNYYENKIQKLRKLAQQPVNQ